jgi:hypothetical protein
MKKINREVDMDWQEGQRRLDHYNQWLMDPKRPLDSRYPGYPQDTGAKRKDKKSNEINELAGRNKPVASKRVAPIMDVSVEKTHTERTSQMSKVTNLSRATEIVKAAASKAEALDKIVAELGVKRANAFVYFTKASKALGLVKADKVAEVVVEKAVKTAKARKANPVTETSPAKAAAKVAEIDAVIAGLRKSGATVSPFAGLGA